MAINVSHMTGRDGVIPSTLISKILKDVVDTMHELKHPDADFEMTMKRGFELTTSKDYTTLKTLDHYLLDEDIVYFVTKHWKQELASGEFFDIPDIFHQYFDARRPIEEVKKLFEHVDLQQLQLDEDSDDEEDDLKYDDNDIDD